MTSPNSTSGIYSGKEVTKSSNFKHLMQQIKSYSLLKW